MPADKPSAEPGVEHSGMDIAGTTLLAEYLLLVVSRRSGILDTFGCYRNVDYGLGKKLRQRKRSSKGKQKPLFRKGW